jgi:hypothetical protein
VSYALWEDEIGVNGRKVKVLKATVERRYKDKDGEWKSSGSFARKEIPLVIWCLQRAFDHMIEEGNSRSDDSIDEEVVAQTRHRPSPPLPGGSPATRANRSGRQRRGQTSDLELHGKKSPPVNSPVDTNPSRRW